MEYLEGGVGMQDKYCIIPKNGSVFCGLVHDMGEIATLAIPDTSGSHKACI